MLEFLVAAGLLGVCVCFCVAADIKAARFWSFAADRDTVLFALRHARARAITGICNGGYCANGAAQGVHFDPNGSEIIIFQGDDFLNRDSEFDEKIELENHAAYFDLQEAVDAVFNPPSGNSESSIIILRDNFGQNAAVSVSESGRVDWQ